MFVFALIVLIGFTLLVSSANLHLKMEEREQKVFERDNNDKNSTVQ